jgi:hypothetical protein
MWAILAGIVLLLSTELSLLLSLIGHLPVGSVVELREKAADLGRLRLDVKEAGMRHRVRVHSDDGIARRYAGERLFRPCVLRVGLKM